MPTLLDPPTTPPSPAQLPDRMLQARHRWAQWRGVLAVLLVGLAVTLIALVVVHPSWHALTHRTLAAAIWGGGFLLTVIAAVIAWRFAPVSLAETAQGLDRRLSAKNRLEAAAALQGSTSALARAQREETAAYLEHQPKARPVRALPWLVGGVMALLIAHLLFFSVWVVAPMLHPAPVATPVPPAPKELPKATITWKSPEAQTMANPIEEVPTVAVAQSTSGLRGLTLEVSVNGEPKKSTPLPAKPFDQAGKNTIKISLYLDEVEAKPFDIVSYYLRGQRVADQKLSDTTSPIQFIQVRPFRDDVRQVPPGTEASKHLALLTQLKLAQLSLVKENFVLAHTDLAVTDPVRVKENDRVGHEQGVLSTKTEEVVQVFITDGLPAGMVDLLRQAEVPMDAASKKILATQNDAALPDQQKALGLIIELEKYIVKIMGQGIPNTGEHQVEDPFKDKQKHELTKRFETAAGQLEQLTKNQTQLAKDLGQASSPAPENGKPAETAPNPNGQIPPAPGANATRATTPGAIPLPTPQSVDPFSADNSGTTAERQARVLQGIGALLNNNAVLPQSVTDALQRAKAHATDSIHQLDQGNDDGAREPAAAAAQDLQRAVTEMNQAGEKTTQKALEDAQAQLNDLAKKLEDLAKGAPGTQQEGLSDVAAKVNDLRNQLADAADQQQQAGSEAGAQQLNNLANQIAQQNIPKDLGDMGKAGLDVKKALEVAQRMEALAGQAAQGIGKPTGQDMARLVNELERSRANLAHLAEKAGGPGGEHPPGQDEHGAGQRDGKGQGEKPGEGQGQGEAPGKKPGQGPGEGAAQGAGAGSEPIQPGAGGAAFREVMADLKNETQQASALAPDVHADELRKQLDQADTAYRESTAVNVVKAYQSLAAPLDHLITGLRVKVEQAKREDIIRQPDLDEAPPSYRPAVSDYFENMSRDYHPDAAGETPKKP